MSYPLKMLLLDQVRNAFFFLTPQALAFLNKAVVKCLQCLLATTRCVAQQPTASITITVYIQWLPGIRLLLQHVSPVFFSSIAVSDRQRGYCFIALPGLPCILASKAN